MISSQINRNSPHTEPSQEKCQHYHWIAVASAVSGVAGIVILTLACCQVFGSVGCMGFISSLTVGSALICLAISGTLWLICVNRKAQVKKNSHESPPIEKNEQEPSAHSPDLNLEAEDKPKEKSGENASTEQKPITPLLDEKAAEIKYTYSLPYKDYVRYFQTTFEEKFIASIPTDLQTHVRARRKDPSLKGPGLINDLIIGVAQNQFNNAAEAQGSSVEPLYHLNKTIAHFIKDYENQYKGTESVKNAIEGALEALEAAFLEVSAARKIVTESEAEKWVLSQEEKDALAFTKEFHVSRASSYIAKEFVDAYACMAARTPEKFRSFIGQPLAERSVIPEYMWWRTGWGEHMPIYYDARDYFMELLDEKSMLYRIISYYKEKNEERYTQIATTLENLFIRTKSLLTPST